MQCCTTAWRCGYHTAIIVGQKAAESLPVLVWTRCPKGKRSSGDLLSPLPWGPDSSSALFHMDTCCPAQYVHKPKTIPCQWETARRKEAKQLGEKLLQEMLSLGIEPVFFDDFSGQQAHSFFSPFAWPCLAWPCIAFLSCAVLPYLYPTLSHPIPSFLTNGKGDEDHICSVAPWLNFKNGHLHLPFTSQIIDFPLPSAFPALQ